MIVERMGQGVRVFHRGEEGGRRTTDFPGFLPYCYVEDESAKWIEDTIETPGFKGVFGTSLTKIEAQEETIRQVAKMGPTWEARIPHANKVLAAHVKGGGDPIPPYKHRVWYLDGEWSIETGAITMLTVHDSFTEKLFTWLWHPEVSPGKHHSLGEYSYGETPIMAFDSEAKLLQHFVNFMRRHDPDIITGWYVAGADIKQIVNRCRFNKVRATTMSPLNRLRYDYGDWDQPIPGRNVIDLMLAFPKIYELKNGKLPGYKLDDVAEFVLGERKVELKDGHDTYWTDLPLYVDYNRQDVRLLPRLDRMVNALDYFIAVQHIAQCDIATTPFVTKVFSSLTLGDPKVDFQIPTSPKFVKEDYEGAIVMEEPAGIYPNVGIFDVKAMYHSNVNLHNISWDTLDPDGEDCGNGTCFDKSRVGLLGRQMDQMTDLRNHYKTMLKGATTDEERVRYDSLQHATKTLVASMYGVAGDSKYGLYHPEIASAITYSSRSTLMRLKEEAESRGCKVRYGHTDSVMCDVDSPEDGLRILAEINDAMAPIVVEFEKWSSRFMLMGKNRYCGLVTWTDGEYHEPQRYVKGIELKQSRMPGIMKEAMGRVIDGVLKGEDETIVSDELSSLIIRVVTGQVPVELLMMKGKLTKNLEDYNSVAGPAAGAQWANRVLGKGYRKDDYFRCVIDPQGKYLAFDDPSEIEGIAEVGYRLMCERFVANKVQPYYEAAGWDFSPIVRALSGINEVWV